MEEVLYIYNLDQCDFYMKNGVSGIGCGIHPKTKRTWIKFRKEDTKKVYVLWLEKCDNFNKCRH